MTMSDEITYRPRAGESIEHAAKAIANQWSEGTTVTMSFNDIVLMARGQPASDIAVEYHQRSEERRRAWAASPEGKRSAARAEGRRALAQRAVDDAMAAFPSVDLGDIGAVLRWLSLIAEPSDHTGVTATWDAVVSALGRQGHTAGQNCGEDFHDDPESFSLWLVGQAMSLLSAPPYAIHPGWVGFYRDWVGRDDAAPSPMEVQP